MPSSLPPLAALRAFEAAARLESFSRAGDEIHVTHGAVSHQVRALEDFVGAPLFVRQGRGVVPTADGRALASAVRAALGQVADAAQAIRRRHRADRLTISVMPSFGSRWLMPRVGGFMAAHPDWEVNIESTAALVDFAREDVDVAVRFGPGPWVGLHAEFLMDDEYLLVASPSLFKSRLPKTPQDLLRLPLLRADPEPWAMWCAAAGVDLPRPDKGIDYQDMGVMLQTAIDGQGVMLARRSIARMELERKTLVPLLGITCPAEGAYWLVWPEERTPSERVLAFRDWIVAEANRKTTARAVTAARSTVGRLR